MASYKTPGVYVKEISNLPASVAQVETAIPAFIGYTESAEKNGQSLVLKPTKISSLLDYQIYFGGAPSPKEIDVKLNSINNVSKVDITPNFYMYDSLRMFYANGGGDCYIVSVAEGFPDSINDIETDELSGGLNALKKEDEPTLIVIPEAVLLSKGDMSALQQAVLLQCNNLQDRFGIFDIKDDEDTGVSDFRDTIGVNSLKYGAAYFPFLKTTLSFNYDYSSIRANITKNDASVTLSDVSSDSTIVDQLDNTLDDIASPIGALYSDVSTQLPAPFNADPYDAAYNEAYAQIANAGSKAELQSRASYIKELLEAFIALTGFTDKDEYSVIDDKTVTELHASTIAAGTTPNYSLIEKYIRTLLEYDLGYNVDGGSTLEPLAIVDSGSDFSTYDVATGITANTDIYGDLPTSAPVTTVVNRARPYFQALHDNVVSLLGDFLSKAQARATNLDDYLKTTSPIYANIVKAIDEEGIILPPSGAIAGIYAYVDKNRGVWKAPANVSISSVVGPSIKIDDNEQQGLNVDVNGGKSVNAIRTFAGKGTLVWGARTLAGNDNEWRYIPVRRLYNMVEESIKKSTSWVVFEPNDANTWIKVKAQIENFLNGLWRDGALAGAIPDDAFFVQVGLGTTMTSIDILEGRLSVEIGMAAVRPAEFVILKFSHMLQKS